MTPRLLSAILPIADIASLTALALLIPMGMHIEDAAEQAERDRVRLETKIADLRENVQFLEEFQIRCFYGETMVIGKVVGVKCVPL